MSVSFRPLSARLASKVLRKSLIQSAERTVEVAPGTSWTVEPPIMLPDEPDRIVGHHSDSTPATNMLRLTGRTIEQGPTRMHLLRDAIVCGGSILTRTAYDRIAHSERSAAFLRATETIPEAAMCSAYVTERYFGHWLADGVAHELLAEDEGLLPLVMDSAGYAHQSDYREALGLSVHRAGVTHCDKLWILEDHERNRHFIARYDRLRQRIGPSRPHKRVFLSRGQGVGRKLLNEDELRKALPEFTFLDPDNSTVSEITETLRSASLVISPEGSACSHALIAMPRGSTLLTIIGAQHFNLPYKAMCDALGIRFALTIADAKGDGFSQPVDRLLATISRSVERGRRSTSRR